MSSNTKYTFYRPHKRLIQEVGTHSLTKQSHKDECDIHNIIASYERTGVWTHLASEPPRFEDLPDPVDYQSALNTLMAAETAFDQLPANVRDHFKNDPAAFLAAFTDAAQHDQLRTFGLMDQKPPEAVPIRPPAPSGDNPPSPGPAAS